jgi:hypothetical protein
MMAHDDALAELKAASKHLETYVDSLHGRLSWGRPVYSGDPMDLIKSAQHNLQAYISRIARVDEQADVVVMFDGARLPVQVEWEDGKPYPSHVAINGKWIDVSETWLSFEPASTHLTDVVRDALFEQAKIEATP